MSQPFPEGKFMATIKLGPKGQIVIPKEVRDMFSLKEGDTLADNSYTTEDQITYTKASEGTVGTEYYVLGIFNGTYDAETDGYSVSIEKSGKTYNCVFEKNEWTVKAK